MMRWGIESRSHWRLSLKSEWTTLWLWCAIAGFIRPFTGVGHEEVELVGSVSPKRWWKEQQRQKSIFAGWRKSPSASKLVVWRSLAAFLPCCFLLWVPFISCQNPSFTVLTLELFIIQIENRGNRQGVNRMRLGIWHPPCGFAPTSHYEIWPLLLYLISTIVCEFQYVCL